jgi:hypothetical protein
MKQLSTTRSLYEKKVDLRKKLHGAQRLHTNEENLQFQKAVFDNEMYDFSKEFHALYLSISFSFSVYIG